MVGRQREGGDLTEGLSPPCDLNRGVAGFGSSLRVVCTPPPGLRFVLTVNLQSAPGPRQQVAAFVHLRRKQTNVGGSDCLFVIKSPR